MSKILLPKDMAEPIAALGVFDGPMSKREYASRKSYVDTFLDESAARIRSISTAIAQLDNVDIDRALLTAYRNDHAIEARAKAAWEVVAWHTLFSPFSHDKRGYACSLKPLIETLQLDSVIFYLYGTTLAKCPDEATYDKLRAMHVEAARAYREYARNYRVAEAERGDLSFLYPW